MDQIDETLRHQARLLYWQGWRLPRVAEHLGVNTSTLASWKRRDDWDGTPVRVLTHGEWMVDDLVGVDEENRLVYFTATLDGPLTSYLYVTGFDGGEPRRLTDEQGLHAVVLDGASTRFVDTFQSLDKPPVVSLYAISGESPPVLLYDNQDPRVAELALEPPELVTLHNREGILLYGAVYRPPEHFGTGPFPAIIRAP